MSYTLEQIEEKYRQLPEAVKEAMYSVETSDAVLTIGKKYNLHIDQVGLLAEEAGLVMLGLTPYYQFMDNIQHKLDVNRATAENITLDINTEIFLPIREFLRQGGGGLPSREEVARDIENPPPAEADRPAEGTKEAAPVPTPKAEAPTSTIFEQKMAKMFKLPRSDPYLEAPD